MPSSCPPCSLVVRAVHELARKEEKANDDTRVGRVDSSSLRAREEARSLFLLLLLLFGDVIVLFFLFLFSFFFLLFFRRVAARTPFSRAVSVHEFFFLPYFLSAFRHRPLRRRALSPAAASAGASLLSPSRQRGLGGSSGGSGGGALTLFIIRLG